MRRVAVTGAAGQIAYSLLFRIAAGGVFRERVALHLLDVAGKEQDLRAIAMELEDCAFPLLGDVRIGSDPREVFEGVEVAFLVGAKPRGPGMERKELLLDNAAIFKEQGRALGEVAGDFVALVVGNPCNTNCLIAMKNAGRGKFYSMMRLDENRARSALARKAGVGVEEVRQVVVWGNHSNRQVPDFVHAKIGGRAVEEMIDRGWLEREFVPGVQKRGAEVIAMRGKSSAASAAEAALGAMKSVVNPSGEWFSQGVYSKGNPYGIDEDLIFSFPCRNRNEIVGGLEWDAFLERGIRASEDELIEEREMVRHLL